jgi:hypothetical protein
MLFASELYAGKSVPNTAAARPNKILPSDKLNVVRKRNKETTVRELKTAFHILEKKKACFKSCSPDTVA